MKARNTEHARYHYAALLCTVWCGLFQNGLAQAKDFIEPKKRKFASIEMQKILFNHVPEETSVTGDERRIELGSLTLYFSERPVINTLPSEKKSVNQVVFFIPHVELKDAALKKTVAKMHRQTGAFHITLEEAQFPVKGMRLILSFDPVKVAYSYDTFDSISLSPGVVFTFYNRALIETLATKSADKGLLRMACSEKKKTVVLDCGHGGLDKGAAPFKGVEEKNITLAVGLKVADLLKKKGIDVVLTRSRDVTRLLDERADIALRVQPALFVSLHANASLRESAQGIETFHVNTAQLSRVRGTLSSNECKITDKLFCNRCSLSADCAQIIHHDILTAAAGKNPAVSDRGVKQSFVAVLLGSRVPAVLVEMGFVSHPGEARLLMSQQYQDQLAKGLCKGIITALDRVAARVA
jgi:N-acetylmuramoyl-L-alanine amidase